MRKTTEKRFPMNPKVRAWLDTLPGKKILVLGLGVSNRPLVRMLLEAGCDVTGCDAAPYEKLEPEVLALEAQGCRLKVGPGYPLPSSDGDESWKPGDGEPKYLPLQVKAGDMAIFMLKNAVELKYDGAKYFIVPQNGILMVERDEF